MTIKGLFGMMEIVYISIMVVVTQLYSLARAAIKYNRWGVGTEMYFLLVLGG